jgi:RNA polymerase sigma-70 factor (ECF subfamily)
MSADSLATNEGIEVSDSELMVRLSGGDDLALNALMARWGARVNSFLFKMTGQREVAVDLAQETFVKLYKARKRYRSSGTFSTYLFTIAANLARNHARWRKRHPTVSLDAKPDDDSFVRYEPQDLRHTPDEAADVSERYKEVHQALLALPHDLREAMTLFVYEGMGYADIAILTKCSPKAVETRIYRARQILKSTLIMKS